jgi:hypothetical protein
MGCVLRAVVVYEANERSEAMNGREALEALERELHGQVERISIHSPAYWPLVAVLEAVHNSALASKDAGPQKGGEIVDHCPHGKIRAPYCHKCAEAIAKANDMNVFPDMVAMGAEFTRLRAWEKWGREQAKPTLEHYAGRRQGFSSEAGDALADMPKDGA